MSGVERGGLLGTGQFAADMVMDASKGGSGVGALLGPTANQILDAVKVMGGRETLRAAGDQEHARQCAVCLGAEGEHARPYVRGLSCRSARAA